MSDRYTPQVLIILDGWGQREAADDNAITAANTPYWDQLCRNYEFTTIEGSGPCVGLPDGQMGNSEVGHLNMGAGRVIHQSLSRINNAIDDGSFSTNPALQGICQKVKANDKALHVFGLLSDGGIHSQLIQIHAMLMLAIEEGVSKVYLHAFLDGRDTPPQSAAEYLKSTERLFSTLGVGRIASICGRYYAMDRDKRWERVQPVYEFFTQGTAAFSADNSHDALEQAYARSETDEFVQITQVGDAATIEDGDGIVYMNFRADRARELTLAFTDPDFDGFVRQVQPKLAGFVTLTEYAADLNVDVAYAPETIVNGLGEYLAAKGINQLRLAETEKYAHVTFFFNGGVEEPAPGEDRILVPSPKVATYDLQPEMSANEVTSRLLTAIASQKYPVIVCNFANPDMVGHTGNFDAAVKAVETIDKCLAKIVPMAIEHGTEILITADHGNIERMYNKETKQPHTAHTSLPVPLLYIGRPAHFKLDDGVLADVAPTLLHLLGLEQPKEMTGRCLIALD